MKIIIATMQVIGNKYPFIYLCEVRHYESKVLRIVLDRASTGPID